MKKKRERAKCPVCEKSCFVKDKKLESHNYRPCPGFWVPCPGPERP